MIFLRLDEWLRPTVEFLIDRGSLFEAIPGKKTKNSY
jgi:hypothetical protein